MLSDNQILEIYHSAESLDILADRYSIRRYNIISIKRKIYYKNVTKDITTLPGWSEKGKGNSFPIPIDIIEKLFYDTGDFEYFQLTYGASYSVVRNIKNKKSFKKITSHLGIPGQVKRYGLTENEVTEIFLSKDKTIDELSNIYKVHTMTIRNIRKGLTRVSTIWTDDF